MLGSQCSFIAYQGPARERLGFFVVTFFTKQNPEIVDADQRIQMLWSSAFSLPAKARRKSASAPS